MRGSRTSRVSTSTLTFSHVTKVLLEALIDNTIDALEGDPVGATSGGPRTSFVGNVTAHF